MTQLSDSPSGILETDVDRVRVLSEALPYIQQFRGRTVVIKYDGAAMKEIAGRFRDTVLGLGGSLPAGDVYRRFRGRDASVRALLADQGLVAAEAG